MKNVLVVYSSLSQQKGQSSRLARTYLTKLANKQTLSVDELDLVDMNLGHLSAEEMQAWSTTEDARTARQKELAHISDSLIARLKAADEVVVTAPMYNFGIPSVLKAWFDRLARAGSTFRYTESGPQGLLVNRPVTILAARGGVYEGTELDTQSAYIRNFFAFIGLHDVRFVYAEGLALGENAARDSFAVASEKIIELTA